LKGSKVPCWQKLSINDLQEEQEDIMGKEGKKHLRSIAVYSTLGKDLQYFIFASASRDSKVTLQLKESVVARVPLLSRTSGLLYQTRSNVQRSLLEIMISVGDVISV
jgi:predicted DNA binding CopG/RHH family protein